ncbi:hypothetical protein NE237_014094 [Protea cynaroides]|uniref:F-box domain-containing protein n=1 Tax=Protea cynaroides TaxID=273540 RepID=A0A9Q0H273_9MAGN|nr:hypothetical protein NE237_014094 [Protea cynaroides]
MSSSDLEQGFFPEEIVLQILSRLPIKSIIRCKCVCKSWHRLLSIKYFIQLYNEVSSKNPMVLVEVIKSFDTKSSFICVDRLMGVSEFSLDFLNDRVKVRASCNGLLCCASIPNKGVYYVCNPMTREYKMLPRTRERPVTRFHPDDEATLVGLAFNLSNLKFNVVLAGFYRPFGHRPLDSFICLVFDSETNTWRRSVSSRSDEFTHMNKNQVVFASGSLHWLTSSCLYILVLDLDNGVWRKISLPHEVVCQGEGGSRFHLLELGGSLSVIQISESWMSIWVLKNSEREEWCMVDKVSLRCIRGLVANVFPISQTEEFMLLATQKQILLYQRKSRVWKEMYSVKNAYTYPLWFSAYAFQSTLFSFDQAE